ncbi:MAG: leucine-rich repeat domain-containing protein [Muribaculaceae bacterium]|nr:leucine-rich repeat domain-containing protein [Muribaculaceae bacterium]
MKHRSLTLLALFVGFVSAQAGVYINSTNFPDTNFRNLLMSSYDPNHDGYLSDSELATITKLYAYNQKIQSLTGIGVFYALQELYVYGNPNLTQLSLSSNKALMRLDCYNCSLTELNVSGWTSMKDLNCSNNQLITLGTLPSSLENLNCYNNRLTGFSFSINVPANMQTIACGANNFRKLTLIKGSSLKTLNVMNCTSLDELICSDNQLTSLSVSGCTSLQTLKCSNNQLTSLSQLPSSLTTLICSINQLTTLSLPTTLEYLECNRNNLSTLNLQGLASLESLYCRENHLLSTLNVQGCSSLSFLDCNNCKLTELNLSSISSLQNIRAYSNNLTSFNALGNTGLEILRLQNNPQLSRGNIKFETGSLQELNLSGTQGNYYDLIRDMPNLQKLTLDSLSNINTMDIHDNPNLTTLSMKNCPTLRSLYCNGNALTSLNVSGNNALQNFSCSSNQLSSVNLSGLSNLLYVDIFNNRIKEATM